MRTVQICGCFFEKRIGRGKLSVLPVKMASSADVDSWKALGGRVDQSSGSWYTATGKLDLALAAPRTQFSRKLYAGEFYSNWKDAAQYLEAHMAKGTPCRDLDDQNYKFHGVCVTENCNKPSKRQPLSDKQEQRPSNKKAKLQAEQPGNPKEAAVKPNSRAKQVAANSAANVQRPASDSKEQPKAQGAIVGSGRQAAQGVKYKEQTALALPDSKVAVKQEQLAADELAALERTKSDTVGPRR